MVKMAAVSHYLFIYLFLHCYRKRRQAAEPAFMSLVIITAGPLLIAIRSTQHTMGHVW